jgi:diaminopimelate decarboxylase
MSATNNKDYSIVAEPGRHFSSESCHLAVRVIGKRLKKGKICYHINDRYFFFNLLNISLYHSLNCILMDNVSFENKLD